MIQYYPSLTNIDCVRCGGPMHTIYQCDEWHDSYPAGCGYVEFCYPEEHKSCNCPECHETMQQKLFCDPVSDGCGYIKVIR